MRPAKSATKQVRQARSPARLADSGLAATALRYATRWRVLPCCAVDDGATVCGRRDCASPGKHPLIHNWPIAATRDPEQISEWWRRWPNANIGVVTGPDTFYVLDVDMHGAVDGSASLAALEEQHGPLPATVAQATGGGGRHYLFHYAEDDLGNRVGLAPGVDFKGAGGFIVVAPSRHASGRRYQWLEGCDPDAIPIAEMPHWLVELVTARPGDARAARAGDDALVAAALPFSEGRRNNDFTSLAGYCLRHGFPVGQALDMALALNQSLTVPLLAAEVEVIVAGTYERYEHPDALLSPHRTDDGNAERLASFADRHLRYVYPWGRWLIWDGTRWKKAEHGEHTARGKELVRELFALAADMEPSDERAAFLRNAYGLESVRRKEAMLKSAQDLLWVAPEQLDTHPMLLNVRGHTIDLETGAVRKPDPDDLLTLAAPVAFDPTATCWRFKRFLHRIFDGNTELIRFVQRAVGYSLTGSIEEHVLFMCWGTGANGKSTFLETIAALLGDYARTAEFQSFLKKQHDHVRNDLARLFSARFVKAVEPEARSALSEPVIKELTGGDTITARFLYQEFFEYQPQFKLWFATNHKPRITGTDEGIWRRILLLPFEQQIPPEERDKHLSARLREDLPGILNWALEGVRMWREEGLNPPPEVLAATEDYRLSEDTLGSFMADCCILGEMFRVKNVELYEAYTRWASANNTKPVGQRVFKQLMEQKGLRQVKVHGNRIWKGITVVREQ